MTRLLTLSVLVAVLAFVQPAHAQQQGNEKDSTDMHHMEMMQDSTMIQGMMKKKMNSPQMRQMMMRMMMQNIQSDSTMMGGDMSGMCMKMCMNMMNKEDMNMNKMPESKNNSQGDTKMKKNKN